jgi:hypothetical protein
MPTSLGALLLRLPFMAASGFIMAFGKKMCAGRATPIS